MSDQRAFLERLPKAELHMHIEGSLEPEMLFALARRNGVKLAYDSVEALRAAYNFSRLQDFLDIYYQGMSVLRTEQDFYDLTTAYLQNAVADGVVHSEIFFDPQVHLGNGVGFDSVIGGIHRATVDAQERHGISTLIIMCFLRDLEEADAERTLDLALDHKEKIVGVGLDSAELGHPPSKFKRVFARARDAGFRLTAHAGEEGPPEYIWEALDVLGVERIDHGVRALEDPALVARLAAEQIALTVCPLSNLRLCVVDHMAKHPLRRLLESGLLATVNSDDPSYFGGYVNDNFIAVQDALGLNEGDLFKLSENSLVASFLPEVEKQAHIQRLRDIGQQ
ncbi:MAG: adenosine deaminase [Pseudomonadota bacterium]